MSKTYVYNGEEVETTGRVATRTSTRGKQYTLYEIKPVGLENVDAKFCKWVKIEDLYHINNNKEE